MRAQGPGTLRWTHLSIGWPRRRAAWYRPLRDWWTARQAAHRAATLASISAGWNATRETFTPPRAEAAVDMAVAQGVLSTATQPYGFAI